MSRREDTAQPRPDHASTDSPQLLRTSVVGSYSVPNWLARFKNEYHRGRLSRAGLREIEEVAIRAAVVDQEMTGLDVISDGEYTRDNDIDYFFQTIPAIEIRGGKHHHLDYFDARLTEELSDPPDMDLSEILQDFSLLRSLTRKMVKVSLAGPFSLAKRVRNEVYRNERDLIEGLARALNVACKALVTAGATHLQLDEPLLAGYPEQVDQMLQTLGTVTAGVDAHVALHVCYGNRYARPAWEGHYDFLFPGICEAPIDELVLEFARKGPADLQLFHRYPTTFEVGVGAVDVKTREVEPVEVIERRLYEALKIVPVERLLVNPDCGLRHLPLSVARRKLQAMTAAAANVRADVLGERAVLPRQGATE